MNRRTPIKTTTVLKFILPGFIIYSIALIVPLFVALGISLTNWRGGVNFDFTGISNYIRVMKDEDFWLSFWHNIQFILILLVMQTGVAFVIALFYQSKKIRFKEFHRRIIFMPAVLSAMVVGMVWQLVYRTDIGFLAEIMRRLGLEEYIVPWLDSPSLVILAICITLSWQFIGQYSIILTAGMQNISNDVLESAQLDGANTVQRAIYIVFPLLKPTFAVCVTMCIAGCMKLFDIIISMSGGGPGMSSMVTSVYTYELAFTSQLLGYASASAICMVILSLALILIARKVLLKGDKDE